MSSNTIYMPRYGQSWAVVVGINKYSQLSPLSYAVNDAQAIAKVLVSRFGFSQENVCLLLDEEADRKSILGAYLDFILQRAGPDDRLLFFFAGHGHTTTGNRSETGFLVPVDGSTLNVSSLIRWDELTRNADLIPAKHIFFLMDACYGGLALTRRPPEPGAKRFMKDMLQRYSRQVLTAGKADQPVSDANGTRLGHSIFTSAVLDWMDTTQSDGITSASALMAAVHRQVSTSQLSRQTPHYGYLEGDGDFFFDVRELEQAQESAGVGRDILYETTPTKMAHEARPISIVSELKTLLSDPSRRIELDDFISSIIRRTAKDIDVSAFPVLPSFGESEFAERLRRYEHAVSDIGDAAILLARWADTSQQEELSRVFARLAEVNRGTQGLSIWLKLGWYPLHFLMYLAGTAAVSADQWRNLKAIFYTRVSTEPSISGAPTTPVVEPVVNNIKDLTTTFKSLPGHTQHYAPRSEYLFKAIQSRLEDLLYLGQSYEASFDRFEIILALTIAHERLKAGKAPWGPVGRFGWKFSGRDPNDPYSDLVKLAEAENQDFAPVAGGMFEGSTEVFLNVARQYKEAILKDLNWF